ncbi:MAG: cytochrome P450 [Ardenticatenaceae bacterium]|nr:cytochrome P450 [Ardenticatenaceae bacterium]
MEHTVNQPIYENMPRQYPPGPTGSGLLGNLSAMRRQGIMDFYINIWQKYGDFASFKIGPMRSYLITQPDHVQHVMVKNRDNYIKGMSHDRLRLSLGYGLLTSENPLWRTQRRLMQPTYTPKGIRQFADMMGETTREMLGRWQKRPSTTIFSANQEMLQITMSVISRAMFGLDISQNFVEAAEALTDILEYTSSTSNDIISLPLSVPTPKNLKLKRALALIDDFIYGIIDQRQKDGTGDDLLYMLMTARDEETGEPMSRQQLHDEVLVTFFAGHETTASLLSWTWYLLAQHPEVERRLHEELARVLNGRSPTLDDLPQLTYTRMILDETLRLYSPVGLTARDVVADDQIDGYQIDAGSMVVIFTHATHRHPDFWQYPYAFYPEHFSPEQVKERPRYAYYPFGAGPRICIGSHFALMEAILILAEAAQHYRLCLAPQPQIGTKFIGVVRPTHDILMHLKPR